MQDAFVEAFRLTLESGKDVRQASIARLCVPLLEWCRMAEAGEARALRHAMLLYGLDQWGLAYSRAFGPGALTGLSELVGVLRDALDPAAEAACQKAFAQLGEIENGLFSFKAEQQKSLLVALWHGMIAEENRDAATTLAEQLGSMMLGLLKSMPAQGWVIVASALADIQIRCLAHSLAAEGLAQEMTQQLFAALVQNLAPEERQRILGGAGQAVVAWQQAQRATAH